MPENRSIYHLKAIPASIGFIYDLTPLRDKTEKKLIIADNHRQAHDKLSSLLGTHEFALQITEL